MVPTADRYNGLGVGPRFAYFFDRQEGVPVDGTNPLFRDLSPFTFRLIPPDALLSMAGEIGGQASAESTSVDLLTAASLGADQSGSSNTVAQALSSVSAVGDLTSAASTEAALASFVAAGRFFTGRDSAFTSTLADALTAADIGLQLLKILTVPPLTLLVNPDSMTISFNKLQSYQSRTRYGFVFEAWGEDQPSISFSGSTAGFVAGSPETTVPTVGQTSAVSGYQGAARLASAAWQNFASLQQFYRNNGYIYDTIGKSEAHQFIGGIAIDYDQWTYVGTIESLSFTFDAESPLRVTWDAEFRVSRMYDTAVATSVVTPLTAPTSQPTTTSRGGLGAVSLAAGLVGAVGGLASGQPDAATQDIASIPFDLLGTR